MQQNPTQDMQPQLSAVCSMTGYGRARQMIGNKEITVELRSVNHRFLEYSSRVPRAYAYLEDKLKNLVKGSVSRGKVDVTLSVQTISGTASIIRIFRVVTLLLHASYSKWVNRQKKNTVNTT